MRGLPVYFVVARDPAPQKAPLLPVQRRKNQRFGQVHYASGPQQCRPAIIAPRPPRIGPGTKKSISTRTPSSSSAPHLSAPGPSEHVSPESRTRVPLRTPADRGGGWGQRVDRPQRPMLLRHVLLDLEGGETHGVDRAPKHPSRPSVSIQKPHRGEEQF